MRSLCENCGLIPPERTSWKFCRECYRKMSATAMPERQCANPGCKETFRPVHMFSEQGASRHKYHSADCRKAADRKRRCERRAKQASEPRVRCLQCKRRRACRFDRYGGLDELLVGTYVATHGELCSLECVIYYHKARVASGDSELSPEVAGLFRVMSGQANGTFEIELSSEEDWLDE